MRDLVQWVLLRLLVTDEAEAEPSRAMATTQALMAEPLTLPTGQQVATRYGLDCTPNAGFSGFSDKGQADNQTIPFRHRGPSDVVDRS